MFLHLRELHRFVPDLVVQRDNVLVIKRALQQKKNKPLLRSSFFFYGDEAVNVLTFPKTKQ